MGKISLILISGGLSVALTGCQGGPAQIADQLFSLLTGKSSAPAVSKPEAQSPPAAASATRTLTPSEAAKQAKENAEILQEVMRVVYDREPGDPAEFGSLVDSMNQGASIEGLYNGFTHSSDYRKLEVENPGARPEALSFFASELARAESELVPQIQFGSEAAQPLALPENPGVAPDGSPGDSGAAVDAPGVSEIDYPGASHRTSAASVPAAASSAAAAQANISVLEASYLKTFSGASIFTLKRVLGDEMLRLVAQKSKDPKALQAWYGAWVARMCGLGVDFGIPLRNKADAAFHAQWASTADPDRLRWEVLNRIHRVLNARNHDSTKG